MFKKKMFIIFLFIFVLFIFISCANTTNDNNNNKKVDNQTTSKVETIIKEESIGVSGGEINSDNINLKIPKDALNSDTNIKLEYKSDTINSINSLGEINFSPSGIKFNKPIELKIKLDNTINDEISLFYYDELNNRYDYVSSSNVSSGYATFNINHFSKYEMIDITPNMLTKYQEIVSSAINNNKNDMWITETYYNYLKNDLHLLDYYQEYDGYYYEACGIFISGNYELDNKKGDPNELVKRYGQTNKVGNKYGLSLIAGEISSYNDYKNKENKQNTIDVSIIIEYKMIKPNITVNASKTKLDVGESLSVSVYVHYINNDNYFYKDFKLPNYKLSVDTLNNNLAIDKKNLLTNDSGNSSFNVTCMDDEKEIVTVIFEVSGDFGAYSSSSITFNDEGDYQISGHIKEEFFIIYYVPVPETSFTKISNGTFKLTIEYDINGNISKNDNGYSGNITISNSTIDASSEKNSYSFTKATGNAYYNFVSSINSKNSLNPEFEVTGYIDNNNLVINTKDIKDIITITVKGEVSTTIEGQTKTEVSQTKATFKNKSKLLDIPLSEGNNLYNYNQILDDIKFECNYMDQTNFDFTGWNIIEVSRSETTSININIVKQ